MKRTRSEKIFNIFNLIILSLVGLACLLSFVNILAKSLSNDLAVLAKEVVFIPKGFNLQAYIFVLDNPQFKTSFTLTIIITILGTAIALLVTTFTAYVFTRKDVPGVNIIAFF